MKQAFFLIPIFALLAFLQTSFLAHFPIQGFVIPIVMIAVLIVSIFISSFLTGLWGVFVGGFVLDVFSQHIFGYWSLIMVSMFCVASFFIHTYVRFPFLKRNF